VQYIRQFSRDDDAIKRKIMNLNRDNVVFTCKSDFY